MLVFFKFLLPQPIVRNTFFIVTQNIHMYIYGLETEAKNFYSDTYPP